MSLALVLDGGSVLRHRRAEIHVLPEARERREPQARVGRGHRQDDAADAPAEPLVGPGERIEDAPVLDVAAVEDLGEQLVAREIDPGSIPQRPLPFEPGHGCASSASPATTTAQRRPRPRT